MNEIMKEKKDKRKEPIKVLITRKKWKKKERMNDWLNEGMDEKRKKN